MTYDMPYLERFVSQSEWLQVHDWCLWCRWFCDMRDDEETTWIEKWATLLNSKHVETQFAIILSSSSSCVVDTQNTQTAVNEEWKIDLTAFTISYSHFWTIRTPQEKINKNAQENDEERRGAASSVTHTYAQTWKPAYDDCTNN